MKGINVVDGKRRIAMGSIRSGVAGVAVMVGVMLAGAVCFARPAAASTIYTYSFMQSGYFPSARPDQDITATLSGSFSFSDLPATGIIGKADLIDFSYDLTDYLAGQPVPLVRGGDLSNLVSFSFHPDQVGSFFLQAHADGQVATDVCVGAAAAFGLCGRPTGFNGAFAISQSGTTSTPDIAFLVTSAGPQVTLTSSVTTPPVATTPIPPTLPLFASAIMALGLFGWQRKWRHTLRPRTGNPVPA
jgi:hypothetical protein